MTISAFRIAPNRAKGTMNKMMPASCIVIVPLAIASSPMACPSPSSCADPEMVVTNHGASSSVAANSSATMGTAIAVVRMVRTIPITRFSAELRS
ncbi:hypothetical protein D6T63_16025 [Arthrobacter cheniae]|uniref:Secreted protein n=1 Tax=Arthrobacter cheniae TaxID=1258888 RepID=A0A3A5M8L2_9MICC|nr:hypothetical protein D6T63_16025 [Arthrobacter cheniae]